MDLARQLAVVLVELRRDAARTQAEMAKALGVSRPTLNRLESASQNTTLKTLERLCAALKCEIWELFRGEFARDVRRRLR
jgi:DNA-binding XRE family transcriptional regulator